MIKLYFSICLLLLVVATIRQTHADSPNGDVKKIKVGDVAPDWQLEGSDGRTYKLSDFKDKQVVIMSWYPMALTGG